MKLINQTKNSVIATEIKSANSFWTRLKGLLGTKKLEPNAGLWIDDCNSIHTFFMNYPIDLIFVDKKLAVKAVYKEVKPFRVTKIIWRANSVFELCAGAIEKSKVELGDQLHVGH